MSENGKTIFISHTHKETNVALCLKESILEIFPTQFDVFVSSDEDTIELGERWFNALTLALEKSEIVLVLCSSDSIVRPWVNFESGAAWFHGSTVIPICHSGLATGDLPAPLNYLQGLEATDPNGIKKLINSLAQSISMEIPASTSFLDIAAKLSAVELKTTGVQRVGEAQVLCACTEVQTEADFDLDIDMCKSIFSNVTIEKNLTEFSLVTHLSSEKFNILHIAIDIDVGTGDLLFDRTNQPARITASRFADIVSRSSLDLIVLGTCESILTAVKVAPFTNMICTHIKPTGPQVVDWCTNFYRYLSAEHTLYESVDLHKDGPFYLIRNRDILFDSAGGTSVV